MNHRISLLSLYSDASSAFKAKGFGRDGFALIHRAAARNHHTRVKKFLIADPSSKEVQTRDNLKLTPLLVAATYGSTKSFQTLLKMGADTEAKTATFLSSVQCAASRRHTNLVLSLINHETVDIFQEIFGYLATLPRIKELHNTMKVLDVTLGVAVSRDPEDKKSQRYQDRIKRAGGVQVIAGVLEACTRSRAMVTSIGPLGTQIIEKMAACRSLGKEITDSSIPQSMVYMMQANDECLLSTLQTMPLLANTQADGCDVFIELGTPRIIMEAIKKQTNEGHRELAMECMYLCAKKRKLAQIYYKQGIFQEFAVLMQTPGLSLAILILVLRTLELMARSGEEVQAAIVEQGIVQILLEKLHYRNMGIAAQVISLLKILCSQRDHAKDILKVSGCTLISVAKQSIRLDTQYQAVELLWMMAGDQDTEKRALASLLGPSCILRILVLSKGDLQLIAITMLRLITPPVYGLQTEIIAMGGVVSLLKVIRLATSTILMDALKALENLSYDLAMRTNKATQRSVLETDGMQLLLRLHAKTSNHGVKIQTLCTLASVSMGNLRIKKSIIQDPNFSLIELIETVEKPEVDSEVRMTAMKTICYLAYNSIEVQIDIRNAKKVPVEPLRMFLESRNKYTSTNAGFHLIVLTRVLETNEDHAKIIAGSMRHLVHELERAISQEIIALQAHICSLLSSLLHIRAGISSAFLASGIVSSLAKLLLSEFEHCRRTSAITISYLTLTPQGARTVLGYCRKTPRLFSLLQKYCEGYTLSTDFMESWEHYKTTHLEFKNRKWERPATELGPSAFSEAKLFGKSHTILNT